jgi:hypothetical protein
VKVSDAVSDVLRPAVGATNNGDVWLFLTVTVPVTPSVPVTGTGADGPFVTTTGAGFAASAIPVATAKSDPVIAAAIFTVSSLS